MTSLFLLVCFLVMWLMVFGVGIYYTAFVPEGQAREILLVTTLALSVTMVTWLTFAYAWAFQGRVFLDWDHLNLHSGLDLLLQMIFAMYAVTMLFAPGLGRIRWSYLLLYIPLWLLFLYVPLAYMIWNPQGWLYQIGVRDFSGGLVVHVSAGVSSWVLLKNLRKPVPHLNELTTYQAGALYLGVILISCGWFGFNMAPAGDLNDQAFLALLNTLLAIVVGACAYFGLNYWRTGQADLGAMMNGMVGGLVTSTAGAGYLSPLRMIMTVLISAILVTYFIQSVNLDDPVDGVAMNALGGLIGALMVGLWSGYWSGLALQTGASLLTLLLSLIISYSLHILVSFLISIEEY